MRDNGYVYVAATRLSLYRTAADWAMVIEVFGFSPRSGLPDTHIHTFASTLYNRDSPEKYVKREAYDISYLANNPNNDSRFVCPIDAGDWQDNQNDEIVAENGREVVVRGQARPLPPIDVYERERRVGVLPDMKQILQLEEWHHPNVVDDEDRPSGSETFHQFSQVLAAGDIGFISLRDRRTQFGETGLTAGVCSSDR